MLVLLKAHCLGVEQYVWQLICHASVQTFSLALVTLFHITAGEPWPEEPLLLDENRTVNWKVCSFHMAYEITVNWVILQVRKIPAHIEHIVITEQDIKLGCSQRESAPQVSVAALLDNFISSSSQIEIEEKLQEADLCVRDRMERNPMEPLLIKLAREFTDNQDLSDRLLKLYKVASGKYRYS